MRSFLAFALLLSLMPGLAAANEVRTFVSGGNLFVYGDADANSISISSPMPRTIRVTGNTSSSGQPTFVNNEENGSAVFENWTNGIYVYLYDGNDEVTIRDADVRGVAHFDLGNGDDQFYAGQTLQAISGLALENRLDELPSGHVDFRSALRVLGVGGDDLVEMNDVSIDGRTTLNLGAGNDELVMGYEETETSSVEVFDTLAILPGSDEDRVTIVGIAVSSDILVDDTTGGLYLSISDSSAGRNLLVYGTSSVDRIRLSRVSATGLLRVIGEGSDDQIFIAAKSGEITINGGTGNDTVVLEYCTSDRLRAYLDGGEDTLNVFESGFTDIYNYGGGGNDQFSYELSMANRVFIYGDGGNDSLNQTANMFKSVRTYSVENR
jgi:hypothetical protein